MKEKEDKSKDIVTFNYIKSSDFRSVLATGVIGGVTINSLIDVNFFTDRVTIPQSVSYEIEANGIAKNEVDRETRKGTVREVHFGAIMDIETAKVIVKWLNSKIEVIEENNKIEQNTKKKSK